MTMSPRWIRYLAIFRLPDTGHFCRQNIFVRFWAIFIIAVILLLLRRRVAAASFNAFSAAAARAILTAAARTQYKRGANSLPSARRRYVIIAVCRSPSAGRTFRANIPVVRRRRSPHRRTRTITDGGDQRLYPGIVGPPRYCCVRNRAQTIS